MVCDIRPVMPHPSETGIFVVNPFAPPKESGCTTVPGAGAGSGKNNGLKCPIHNCCELTIRSFPCVCGKTAEYCRYEPAQTPNEYAAATQDISNRGVWRWLQSLDDVNKTKEDNPQAEKAPSEQLRIARRGRRYTGMQLGPMILELEAAIANREFTEQNLKKGGPLKEFQAANTALVRSGDKAWQLQDVLNTWKRLQETLEMKEYGRIFADNMPV
ncbi:hypothetical protein F5Y19DRAFT_490034 [Xylariaceae sp. FL1651]|nr:hypothetical protein F5Y19DRAFT_490034 [Xylariaceae sp. FL1651]